MNQRQKLVQQSFLSDEKRIIKRLNQVYGNSLMDINAKIQKLTLTIDGLQQQYDWMDVDDPDRAKVKSMIQSKIYQKQYQEQLQKQVSGIYDSLLTSGFATVSEYLDQCYTDGFIGTIFDAHGQGIPIIAPIDQKTMVRAVQLESKISKGLYTRLGEDVDLLKKKITAQVSRSIATGMTYAQTAKALENYTRIGYNNAIRIARTEGHRIQTTATMDAMEVAKEKGADVLKQWDATLDGRTRESHQAVDGEIREIDKSFSNGLDFPGDPSGGAAEVVNCRCALLQRAKWALDDVELQTLRERAEYFGLDKADQFDDFKQKYLKAVQAPDVVVQPIVKYQPNHSTELAKKFGNAHYDEMHKMVVDCTDQDAMDVWKKYEADIEVADAHSKSWPHASGKRVYLDIDKVAKGDSYNTAYQTAFHECGHALDSAVRSKISGGHWGARHYSAAYADGLFPQTIKDEVQAIVKVYGERIKAAFKEHAGDLQWFIDHGYMYSWQKDPPKYSKSMAYSALEKEIRAIGSKYAISDLSDILEGATGAKIQCGFGHGAKYWKDRTTDGVADGLATEAFAEMISATFSNPESLETIKKYLPKSYGVFQDMLRELKK